MIEAELWLNETLLSYVIFPAVPRIGEDIELTVWSGCPASGGGEIHYLTQWFKVTEIVWAMEDNDTYRSAKKLPSAEDLNKAHIAARFERLIITVQSYPEQRSDDKETNQ